MNKKFKYFFLGNIEKQRKNRSSLKKINKKKLLNLWSREIKYTQMKSKFVSETIIKTFKFAKNLQYNETGSSKELYFLHLLRISCMALLIKKKIDAKLICLALLHHVFETGNLKNKYIIKEKFGKEIFDNINKLTVNRKIEWNKGYKNRYYQKLNSGSKNLRIVKILDKFDNLFLLDINKNINIKRKYIKEIIKYILPMAKRTLPELYNYYKELVQYNCLKIYNEKKI